MDLLELFHTILMEGPISKRAFAVAIRLFFQKKTMTTLPDIVGHFYNAYSHWLEIKEEAERTL